MDPHYRCGVHPLPLMNAFRTSAPNYVGTDSLCTNVPGNSMCLCSCTCQSVVEEVSSRSVVTLFSALILSSYGGKREVERWKWRWRGRRKEEGRGKWKNLCNEKNKANHPIKFGYVQPPNQFALLIEGSKHTARRLSRQYELGHSSQYSHSLLSGNWG